MGYYVFPIMLCYEDVLMLVCNYWLLMRIIAFSIFHLCLFLHSSISRVIYCMYVCMYVCTLFVYLCAFTAFIYLAFYLLQLVHFFIFKLRFPICVYLVLCPYYSLVFCH